MANAKKTKGFPYKLALGLLVALFLVAMVASFVTAARRVSRVVDPDYYSHGLNYGADQAARAGSAALSWTITPTLLGQQLQVRVADQSGAPVSGGQLSFEPQGAPAPAAFSWTEAAPGLFRTATPAAGITLRGTLRFSRGPATLSQKLVLLP
jgi:nitrogen fixation protein FixH